MIRSPKPSVIVTASTGLLGAAVVHRLSHDFHVHAWDAVEPSGPLPHDVTFQQIDVTSPASIDAAVDHARTASGGRVVSLIHTLAHCDVEGQPSDLYEQITVQGSLGLLRSVLRHSLDLEQFIFVSTMLVHAPTVPGKPINERRPLEPRWDYPQSAVETEELLREEHGELPLVLLRLAHLYTDACDLPPLAQQIQRIYERRLVGRVFPGDIHHGQAAVHLDDAVEAIARTIDRRAALPDEYALLIGEPVTLSYDALQRRLAELIHGEPNWQTRVIPKALARTGVWVQHQIPGPPGPPGGDEPFVKPWMLDVIDDHYELDIHRAMRELGWQPTRSLADTLPRMVEALNRDPVRWYRRHQLRLSSELEAQARAAGQ